MATYAWPVQAGERAFRTAFDPVDEGARLAAERLFERFAGEPEPALRDALAAARRLLKNTEAQTRAQRDRLSTLDPANHGSLPPPVASWREWLHGRSLLAATAAPSPEDPLLAAAFAAGDACCDLGVAARTLDRVIGLRIAAPEHPGLRDEVRAWPEEMSAAHEQLEAALSSVRDRPAVAAARLRLGAAVLGLKARSDATRREQHLAAYAYARELELAFVELMQSFDVPLEPAVTGPPTREELELVAAILAAPDDDALRLRFAEVAGRRREPRAALVRAQHAADAPGRLERVRGLLRSYPEWSQELAALGATDVTFHLGFADAITIDAATLIERADAIFGLAPVRRLRLERGSPGLGAALAGLRWLAQVRALSLFKCGLEDADVAALAASPFVTRLRYLNLGANAITDRGVEAVAASERLRGLVSCGLKDNPCTDPVDENRYSDETHTEWVPTDAGRALEEKHGPLAWLHPPAGGWHPKFDEV